MKVRSHSPLVSTVTAEFVEIDHPRNPTRLRVPPAVLRLLLQLTDWCEIDEVELPSELAGREPEAVLRQLVAAGLLDTEAAVERHEGEAWQHWGPAARRFHRVARDADYTVHEGRDEVVAAILDSGPEPADSKSYPGAPRLLLPRTLSPFTLDLRETLERRRTYRVFSPEPVRLDQLATVLHYSFAPLRTIDAGAFGVRQLRASASAGGRHEVECYVAAFNVEGVPPGLYHYEPLTHALELLVPDLGREQLADLTYHQKETCAGAFTCFTTVVAQRIAYKYRHPRAYRLWMYDAGHYGQTFAMTCTGLGLGAFQTVAFKDSELEALLGVDPEEEFAAYALSAGRPLLDEGLLPVDYRYPPLSGPPRGESR
ncbi:SagB-type dehydrogenase family enzyme [Kitasatospora sp. MAP12-15]|uniref:SagB/ThcOx family dehydrogenase n=1 Tax=unclassified Kitasatospora TaxID=2633591 RepID=UPI002476CBB6|nr:SagB/ThcOx family dehydrogenase [Kitasatospora sp. MAP12-44]MDH6111065.1 SagB-type dehydrogenase family enzyme [Kitasatospora sp. MAP12-44]